jgi:hypothetical protein
LGDTADETTFGSPGVFYLPPAHHSAHAPATHEATTHPPARPRPTYPLLLHTDPLSPTPTPHLAAADRRTRRRSQASPTHQLSPTPMHQLPPPNLLPSSHSRSPSPPLGVSTARSTATASRLACSPPPRLLTAADAAPRIRPGRCARRTQVLLPSSCLGFQRQKLTTLTSTIPR